MHWDNIKNEIAARLHGNSALADERPFIVIDSSTQELHRVDIDEGDSITFKISTAKNGLGNRSESFRTPTGIHRIKQKIGGGQPCGMVFQGREPTGKIVHSMNNTETDDITSRILWLDGMEEGSNRGGNCDTYSRYIYIHGTSDEGRLGLPVSAGCIRMKNDDVITLFDEVLVNDLVIIR
ncbi:MAG: lipoprotein-anchoring transpeptidase ErfK/SrfK [Planctomycetota bacterium]|jgi:lipoprotein-anchoring transpeptidase ErfK/SrfK